LSVELLLQNFERISDAPDAVARLRRFVIDLAVKGRLSDRHMSEEPPKEAKLAAVRAGYTGSDLPANWVCAPLGDLIELKYGKGLPAAERIEHGRVAVYGSNGIVARTREAIVEDPAIIVGRKGSAGALVLADGPSWTTDVAYYVVPPSYLEIRFLFLALHALRLDTLGKGVKPGLSRSDANPLRLAVPPVAEQHQIVTKVDELMPLLDELEVALALEKAERGRLLESLLDATLNGAPD
jgi:type I restriction enzyme S subunit